MDDTVDDADVTVDVEDDTAGDFTASDQHEESGSAPMNSFLNDLLGTGVEYLELYGWYIVIASVIMYIILSRRQSHSSNSSYTSARQRSAANSTQSSRPEQVDRRSAAARENDVDKMLQARLRQQEENDKRVAEFHEAQMRKQAERAAEQVAEYERLNGENTGYKLGSSTSTTSSSKPSGSQPSSSSSSSSGSKPSTSSARLRPSNYMPLGGSASGSSYRPGGGRCRPGARSS